MVSKNLNGWNENETLDFYINHRNKYSELYESEKYFITQEFIANIKSVLDVGCSVGGMYNVFREFNKNIIYTGLDVSENAILKAKEIYKNSNINFYFYNGLDDFPLKKNQYDLVFCSGVMHLIDNYKNILKQMIERSEKYVLVDFRLTTNKSYTGKFYFSFKDEKKKEASFTNYHVLNFKELIDIFKSFHKVLNIDVFGYKGKPSHMSEDIDDVYMVFFKIEKKNNLAREFNINFQSKELEKIFLPILNEKEMI